MKTTRLALLLVLVLALAGCGRLNINRPTPTAAPPVPAPSATVLPTAEEVNKPAPGKITATPEPAATPTQALAALPQVLAAPSFRDCALAPGWRGCDPSKPPVAGRLALFHRELNGVAVLDLENGGWQMAAAVSSLAWSPSGERLLLGQDSGSGMQYQIYGPDLTSGETISAGENILRWQPGDRLGGASQVFSPKGDEARLEYTADGLWLLHVIPAGGEQRTVEVESQPTDLIYSLVAWIPGTEAILAQAFYASNAAVMFGGQLVTLNAQTGVKHLLEPFAALDERAAFRWSPVSNTLAFIAGGSDGAPGRRLALVDFSTGQVQYPLPEGVQVNDLAWSPDGSELVLVTAPAGQPEGAGVFATPGIYRYSLSSQAAAPVVTTPDGALDGFLHWTQTGELIYARAALQADDSTLVTVSGRDLASGEEWVIVQGLPGPRPVDGQMPWQQVLAYAEK